MVVADTELGLLSEYILQYKVRIKLENIWNFPLFSDFSWKPL